MHSHTFERGEKEIYIMPSQPIPIKLTQADLDARAALAEGKAKAKKENKKMRDLMRSGGMEPRRYNSDSD